MKTLAAVLAFLIALASPDLLLAKTSKVRAVPKIRQSHFQAAGGYAPLYRRPLRPHPEWDVYRLNGRYAGTDPDPLVRLMLLRDRSTEYP